MTERFNNRLRVIGIVLKALAEESMNWTPLVKLILKWSTPWKAQSTLYWLMKENYIERPVRGVYVITEKGRQFLKAAGLDDKAFSDRVRKTRSIQCT